MTLTSFSETGSSTLWLEKESSSRHFEPEFPSQGGKDEGRGVLRKSEGTENRGKGLGSRLATFERTGKR